MIYDCFFTCYLNFIDFNGCYIDTSFIISEPNPLVVTLDTLSDVSCYNYSDGFLNVSGSGGIQPYSFQWNGPNNFYASTLNINNLFAGVYNLTLTDNNNCIYIYQQDVLEDIEIVTEEDFDNMVNEVMKRVTKRIIRERIKK